MDLLQMQKDLDKIFNSPLDKKWDPIIKIIEDGCSQDFINIGKVLLHLFNTKILNKGLFHVLMLRFGFDNEEGGMLLYGVNPVCLNDELVKSLKDDPFLWREKFIRFMQQKKYIYLPKQIQNLMTDTWNNLERETGNTVEIMGYILSHINLE